MGKRIRIPRPSAIDFILSPRGRKALREALKAVTESERKLAEARRVS